MKWSYTTWHGWACGTHLRRQSDDGSPVAMTCSTDSSTVRRHLSSTQTTRSLEVHSSNNVKQGSRRKVAIRTVISDHPSPILRKTVRAIPMTPVLVIQNRASGTSPAEAAGSTYHQSCGFQRKPKKGERQTGNAPAVAAETTKPSFVPNTAR